LPSDEPRQGSLPRWLLRNAADEPRSGSILGWLARGAGLTALLAVAAYGVVFVLDQAGLFGYELSLGNYGYVLFFCAFGWPIYVAVIARIGRRGRWRFRRAAIALSPVIGLPLTIGIIFVNVPEILAGWIMWLSLGALLPPPPPRRSG